MSIQLNRLNTETRDLEQNECDAVAGGFFATVAAIAGGISAVAGGIDTIDKVTSNDPQGQQAPNGGDGGASVFSNPNQAIKDAVIVDAFS